MIRLENAAKKAAIGKIRGERPAEELHRRRRRGDSRGSLWRRVSHRAKMQFTRQLSMLYDAGLPLARSLAILEEQEQSLVLRRALREMREDVQGGAMLSEAMAWYPRVFNRMYVQMVQAGESGGQLDTMLKRLAAFMEKSERRKRRLVARLLYPAFVLLYCVAMMMGVMLFAVPPFREVFRNFHMTLPEVTQWVIDWSDWMRNQYGWAVILGMPPAAAAVMQLAGSTRRGRQLIDWVKIKAPIFGGLGVKAATGRFARTLGTLLTAGVPMLDALRLARETVGNVAFERGLQKAEAALRMGEPLARSLGRMGLVEKGVVNSIEVAEEAGHLRKTLLQIAEDSEQEVEARMDELVSMAEPLAMAATGLMVLITTMAMLLPFTLVMTVSGGD